MTGASEPIPVTALTERKFAIMPSDATVGVLGWMSLGACHGEDPELFFPCAGNGAALHQITAAKAVCARCPVRATCLAYAVKTGQDGIWGATTREERRALRQYRVRPPRQVHIGSMPPVGHFGRRRPGFGRQRGSFGSYGAPSGTR